MDRPARIASLILAAAAAALSACAHRELSTSGAQAEAPVHFYCHQSRLHEFAGRLSCNWQADPAKACADPEPRNIARAATTGRPVRTGAECPDGSVIVRVTVGEAPRVAANTGQL